MRAPARGWIALTLLASALGEIATLGCEHARRQPRADTATTAVRSAPPETAQAPPSVPAWDSGVGPVLLVRDSSVAGGALVIFPDSARFAALRGATLDLLDRSGEVGHATITHTTAREAENDRCMAWPAATLHAASGAMPTGWTVAFVAGRAHPLPLAPIERLASADSARFAADVTRLASAIPDSTTSHFRGLPFVVVAAYRFAPAPRVAAVIADLVRKLNQEANPLQEHTLLIAEGDSTAERSNPVTLDSASARGQLRTVYTERAAATEERIVTSDVLAALTLDEPPPPRAALVLGRVGYDATAYALLERTAAGTWHVRWTSTNGC